MTGGNIDNLVSSGSVKLHVFAPSNRKIWTVVGKEKEYWLDPNLGFCSCEDFYYNEMAKNGICYHLKAVLVAKEENKIDLIRFSDAEFESFITALIADLII